MWNASWEQTSLGVRGQLIYFILFCNIAVSSPGTEWVRAEARSFLNWHTLALIVTDARIMDKLKGATEWNFSKECATGSFEDVTLGCPLDDHLILTSLNSPQGYPLKIPVSITAG
jgi:hypothetical protein